MQTERHAPLNGTLALSFEPTLTTSSVSQANDERTVLPQFLPQTLPISMNPSRIASQPFTLGNYARNVHSSLAIGVDGVTSLSDSSSLSSSLISLQSTPPSSQSLSNNSCQLLATSFDLQLPPGPRCSLWLKLRVCPSWVVPSVNTQLKTSLPTSLGQDFPTVPTNISVKEEKTEESNSANEDPAIFCPLFSSNCPYAHPSPNVRVEAGHVTVCYDFIKRKNCKHTCCKYYHPPPHQIETILKRGDEQKKLMESQQRILETKVSTYMKMQPQPSAPNGLSAVSPGACNTNIPWSLTTPLQPTLAPSPYGTYLSAGQPLPGTLNPMATFHTPYVSTVDSTPLNATAFLAAAAALQQHNLNASSLIASSTKAPSFNCGASYATTPTDQHMNTMCHSTSLAYSLANGHCTSIPSRPVNVSEQQLFSAVVQAGSLPPPALTAPAPARIDAALPPSIGVNAVSLVNGNVIPPTSSTTAASAVTATTTLVPTVQPEVSTIANSIVVAASSSAVPSHHAGMKREASSLSSASSAVSLDMHSWCPPKRPNRSVTDLLPESESTEVSDSFCNGTMNGQRTDFNMVMTTASMNENATSLTACLSVPSTCCSAFSGGTQVAHSSVSSLFNPISLYSLPFSNQQALASSLVGAPHLAYSPMYPSQVTPDPTNAAASLTFNPWLPQQLLSTQVPVHQTTHSNPSLAAAMATLQPQQPSSDLSTTSPSSSLAFHHQQQQAVLLSLILRAQQSQLAAAQLAAAVQATGTTGLLAGSAPSRSAFAGLPSACVLDTSFPYPGTVNGIAANPYSATMSSIQNPITNVAYVNEKGHLLETLPICRDFKAGKCHRNADCRYVHLVDEYVEVNQGRVIVCRDAAKGRCTRVPCKYYHVPLLAISANRSLALNSALATASVPANQNL